MGSALETLCGQAYGAGQLDMMGLYLQRSWVILIVTALLLSPLYIFTGRLFRLIGLPEDITKEAGKFSLYMIPQLFTNGMYFPITNFLRSQSKMVVMAVMGVVTLASPVFFSWLLILRVGWGLKGAAVSLNASYLLLVVAQLTYIVGGTCGKAWTGFSWKAFRSLCAFVRLSLASAVMLCLELWYFVALLLFAGHLQNPNVSLDGLSIWDLAQIKVFGTFFNPNSWIISIERGEFNSRYIPTIPEKSWNDNFFNKLRLLRRTSITIPGSLHCLHHEN